MDKSEKEKQKEEEKAPNSPPPKFRVTEVSIKLLD